MLLLVDSAIMTPDTLVLSVLVGLLLGTVILRTLDESWQTMNLLHACALGTTLLMSSHLLWSYDWQAHGYWQLNNLWGIAPLTIWAVILLLPYEAYRRYYPAYQQAGAWMCFSLLLLWLLMININAPITTGTHLPFINITDVLQLSVFALCIHAFYYRRNPPIPHADIALWLAAGFGLFAVSALVIRTWHWYTDIAWQLSALLANFGLQASLSLTWSIIGISLMVIAARTLNRLWWIVGATLMAVVVTKLFIVELGDSGGVARIVSFIGVGLLLLLVGWFAPVPPKR